MHCEAYAVLHITKQAMKIGFLLQKIKELNCIQVMYRSSILYFQYKLFFLCVIPVVCVTNKEGGEVKQHN
jgi:hypothetical protein